jgi:hypothetical protein
VALEVKEVMEDELEVEEDEEVSATGAAQSTPREHSAKEIALIFDFQALAEEK